MGKNIKIFLNEGNEPVILPLDEYDDTLLLSVLQTSFPKAVGLRTDSVSAIKLCNGKFYPPENGWGDQIYHCVQFKEIPNEEIQLELKVCDENRMNIKMENNEEDSNELQVKMTKKIGRHRKSFSSTKRPHRCDICGNCFTQQSHMLRHRRIHTGEKPFGCEQCAEKFSRSDKLKLHYEKCHSMHSEELEVQLPSQDIIMRDRREKKPKVLDDSYEWGTLPPTATTTILKSKHLTVRFKKNAKIDLDNGHDGYYSVVNMAEVEMEDEDLQPAEVKPEVKIEDKKSYNCTICCKNFAKKNQLQRHTRIHTGERPFKCQTCNKSFTRIDALKRHTASVGHQKQKEQLGVEDEFTIPEEMDNFVDAGSNGMDVDDPLGDVNSVEHQIHDFIPEDDDDDDDGETSCDVASFAQVTYNLDNIKEEAVAVVNEMDNDNDDDYDNIKERPVKESVNLNVNVNVKEESNDDSLNGIKEGKENYCYQCNHLFTNRFNFNRHMKSHEREEKSFRCPYCHYIFRRQSHLTRHVLIHTGEKPFQCTYCHEKFSRSDKLKIHVKRTHAENIEQS